MPYKDPERARQYQRKWSRKWYKKNRNRILKQKRINYEKNKSHIHKCQAVYRQKNRGRIRRYNRIYYKNNLEKCRDYAKKYRIDSRVKYMKVQRKYDKSDKGKKSARKQNLKRKGITLEQYDQTFGQQKGVCAICGKPEIAKNQFGIRRLAVDHNHATGKSRGLLCVKCNTGLGSFSVDEVGIELLLKAIEYVRKHSG